MGSTAERSRFERCLDTIYDAPVSPRGWQNTMADVAALFGSAFADICTWTHDRRHVAGLAHGLDRHDYDDVFLGVWFNRNVWSREMPVRVAGEVVSTRQMVAREDLCRSEIYHDYLAERGLHEGLRLSLWVEEAGLADISVLRPWSAGAFGPAEVELGQALLPHLQRAATLTRRLHEAAFSLEAGEGGAIAAIAFDRDGLPFWFNDGAQAVVARGHPLRLAGRTLAAATGDATSRLRAAVAAAVGSNGVRRAGTVLLPLPDAARCATLVVQPLSGQHHWTMPRAPAALAFLQDPQHAVPSTEDLRQMFGLTAAEAQLAVDLLGGLTVNAVAARSGRSRNTTRTHLARLMEKTGTARQVDLVRLLNGIGTLNGAARRGGSGASQFAGWLTTPRQ